MKGENDVTNKSRNLVVLGEKGAAYLFHLDGTEIAKLTPGDNREEDWFGSVVSIDEKVMFKYSLVEQYGKTIIYSNTSPDLPKIAGINQGGLEVAVSGDRIIIGTGWAKSFDGAAWLYDTDGTLVKTLDRQDASSYSFFGDSVAVDDGTGAAYLFQFSE